MAQTVLNVAYGMNSSKIPGMTTKQMIAAFFMASENLPSINDGNVSDIVHNMDLIADEMSERTDRAKGRSAVKYQVHLAVMQAICKTLPRQNTDHLFGKSKPASF